MHDNGKIELHKVRVDWQDGAEVWESEAAMDLATAERLRDEKAARYPACRVTIFPFSKVRPAAEEVQR